MLAHLKVPIDTRNAASLYSRCELTKATQRQRQPNGCTGCPKKTFWWGDTLYITFVMKRQKYNFFIAVTKFCNFFLCKPNPTFLKTVWSLCISLLLCKINAESIFHPAIVFMIESNQNRTHNSKNDF